MCLRSGEDALYLATNAFRHGLQSFLQVLDAQRTVTSTRQQLVQANATLATDVVALYRALGGGWKDPGSRSQAPTVPVRASPAASRAGQRRARRRVIRDGRSS